MTGSDSAARLRLGLGGVARRWRLDPVDGDGAGCPVDVCGSVCCILCDKLHVPGRPPMLMRENGGGVVTLLRACVTGSMCSDHLSSTRSGCADRGSYM